MGMSHTLALQEKHRGLDARLQQEMSRPLPDSATIQSLKKQKLMLKEEITHS